MTRTRSWLSRDSASGISPDLVRTGLPDVAVPHAVGEQSWVVYCEPAVQGPDNVLTCLGRYVHRVAITNGRIVRIDGGKVTFHYQNAGDAQWRAMRLTAHGFIRRFLQHVPPKGLHKVRYYGLWAPANKAVLLHLRRRLTAEHADQALPGADEAAADQTAAEQTTAPACSRPDSEGRPCPYCHKESPLILRRVPAQQRPPP